MGTNTNTALSDYSNQTCSSIDQIKAAELIRIMRLEFTIMKPAKGRC